MKKLLLIIFLFGFVSILQAQVNPVLKKDIKKIDNINQNQNSNSNNRGNSKNTTNRNIKHKGVKISEYKIISYENDTTFVDTTLTVKKEYKYNYLRKDYFELLPFSNIGQTFNTLSYNFENTNLLPEFAAQAKHFNYLETEDVNYYHVPTPLTELLFKTVFEQGQLLDAFFTTNISKQLNFSFGYKGLRSLGKYQHILSSSGNFRFTTNYKTKNKRYNMRAHVVMQDIFNQENGGLSDEDITNFESGADDFLDRSTFDPIFQNAGSSLEGKRYFLDHSYAIINEKDSLSYNTLKIGNVLSFEDKFYDYKQNSQNDLFGNAFIQSDIFDNVTLENFYAEANATYANNIIGDISFNVGYTDYNYGYNKLVVLNNQTVTNRLKGNVISAGGSYKKQFGDFSLKGKLGININGDLDGNFLLAKAAYKLNDDIKLQASLNSSSRAPNYNFLLYQSEYKNYNWQNTAFKNIETQQITFDFLSDKWLNLSADYATINNYTYFKQNTDDKLATPTQSNSTINYARLKLQKSISYKNFTLDNTVMYQKVLDGEGALNVPEIITRNTLYYSNHLFKRALYLQTGINFQYFTKYNMNAYSPLLGEFQVQNQTELGGFPRLDFFVNAKVQQTRIYFKAEHVNSAWTDYNFYSAPNYPYRDFVIRFGLVWNFFL